MRTLFYGTPALAVPFLELLAERGGLAAVVSQPDRPAGRSLRTVPTPVAERARQLGLTLLQPARPSELVAALKPLRPDLAVAVAYGRILKSELLAVPRLGTLNVHFSLLPAYRGAAPVQWSLAHGETRGGVTVFWLDEGMDTGPVCAKREIEIGPDDDSGLVFEKLRQPALDALSEALDSARRGQIVAVPQEGRPSYAPLIKREDAELSLERPAKRLHDLVRAFCLWPKANLRLRGGRLLVLKTRLEEGGEPSRAAPGAILRVDRSGPVLVQCGFGSRLWFLSVQPEGKKAIGA
ncbi:MAG: methionyl-tRNA formyltransferase, partial [Elusimicrobia bacterium]|nr:methionyl-tRNA formyltransferase [Elusimicrobiota bacterium]